MQLNHIVLNSARLYHFIILIMLALPLVSIGQTDVSDDEINNSQEKINRWNITAYGGALITWGDLNNEPSNPFGNYFTDQQGIGYGIMLTRRFGNTFSANLQYLGGSLQGQRSTWSGGTIADLEFKSPIHDINLNLEIDLINLFFQSKEHRLFSAYIKGGIGYVMYNPTVSKTSTGAEISSSSGSSMEIPWGWGIKSDFSKHWSIRFENTFHHALVDDIDGHGTQFSTVNDIYNFTSLGLTYRIYQKPKQAKLPKIKEIEPADTSIAEVETEIVEEIFELSIAANIPKVLHPFDTSEVTIRINKGPIEGKAKLQQTIPTGFTVMEISSGGGQFDFRDQTLSYSWDEIPESETIDIKYKLIAKNASLGSHSFAGIMFYNQDEIEQVRQFKKNIDIEASQVIVKNDKTEAPVEVNPIDKVVEQPAAKVIEQPKGEQAGALVYRVQVYAVYGGTTSPKLLERRLNLDHEVKQDYQGDYAKYTSGSFSSYEEAAAYKEKLRNSTVPGAFVVGFYENNRLNHISEAIAIEKGESKMRNTPAANVPMGLIYRVQIAASSRDMSVNEIKGITGIDKAVQKVTHNGLFKYEVGNYTSYDQAKTILEEVRAKVPGAFMVKYRDGVRL